MGRTTPQMIRSRGFDVQIHHVETDDGYILSLHRLVKTSESSERRKTPRRAKKKRREESKKKLKPIILHHGLMGSSIDFVINSPGGCVDEDTQEMGNNLAFELAKRDYDVWLANVRGNMYSLDHRHYKSSDPQYWDFSLDEHVAYDLPAIIDYIKETCNASTVGYVGYSQGTSMMFALLASQEHYSTSIKPFIALAPVASPQHVTAPLGHLAEAKFLIDLLGRQSGPFFPDSLMRWLSAQICNQYSSYLCGNALFFMVGGFDSPQLNFSRIPVYTSTQAYGTSIKNVVHWSQLLRKRRSLAYFDYGKKGNLIHYGQTDAPVYPLERINSSFIALFSSHNDGFATQVDVDRLRALLKGQLLDDYIVPYKLWSHLDFIWALEAAKYINTRVLSLLNLYA